jgi:cyclopropane fatty-acyl-phospholipid synthase-like methyltransferase
MATPPVSKFTDRIGQRLNDPKSVPAEFHHLIGDDHQRVTRLLQFPLAGRVLDVGCSDGAITQKLADAWPGVQVTGCDVRASDYRPSFLWDIRHPTLPTLPYHAIVACEVFEHLTDADAESALANLMDHLDTGGQLIVTVPNRHPHDLYEVSCRSRWAWPDHRSAWTWDKLRNFLQPYFGRDGWLEKVPLYPGEQERDSIWLIARAKDKR